jgi:hypothetical protein
MSKRDHRNLNRRALRGVSGSAGGGSFFVFNSVEYSRDDIMRKVMKYKQMYDNLSDFRQQRERCMNYLYGRQWEDSVYDFELGKWVKERTYILSQNRTPFQHNIIHQILNTYKGLYRSNRTSPVAVTRDRSEQKVGEMMSIALEQVYTDLDIQEIDVGTFEEFFISGLCAHATGWAYNFEKQIRMISLEDVEISHIFFNSDYKNDNNLSCIGAIYDMPLTDVISTFWQGSEARANSIREIYGRCRADDYVRSTYQAFSGSRFENVDFFMSSDINNCRVILSWELESKERMRCYDYLSSSTKIDVREYNPTELAAIERENAERISEASAQGVSIEDVLLIEVEPFIDRFWYVRYLTPTGEVLFEQETPYAHRSNPFTLVASFGRDGRIYSPVWFLIDAQRKINRYESHIDFIVNSAVKDTLVVYNESLGEQTVQEIASSRSKIGGVVSLDAFRDGANGAAERIPAPQVLPGSGNGNIVGLFELMQFFINQIQTMSGANSALQGQSPSPGTPAYRYAQESQNATNNLRDTLDKFTAFRRKRDFKIMKLIAQYYDTVRYINIAGKQYDEESRWYDPDRVRTAEFDISISESSSSPTYRALLDDLLMQLYNNPNSYMQGFDLLTFLRNSSFPQADIIAHQIEANQQKIQSGQSGEGGGSYSALERQGITPELAAQIASQADADVVRQLEQAVSNSE